LIPTGNSICGIVVRPFYVFPLFGEMGSDSVERMIHRVSVGQYGILVSIPNMVIELPNNVNNKILNICMLVKKKVRILQKFLTLTARKSKREELLQNTTEGGSI
jgi:hypothetical protein